LKTAEVDAEAVEAEAEPEVDLTELREPETTEVAKRAEPLTSLTSLLCDEKCCFSALL